MQTRNIRFLAAALIVGATLAACHDSTTSVHTATTITTSTTALTGTVGQALAAPVDVHVADQNGAGMAGVLITWTVAGSGGTVDSVTSTTNANGDAFTDWSLGTKAGLDTLTAATSTGLSTTITATANAGALASIINVTADSESVSAGNAAQLVVKAVDQYGNPVSGVTITWSDNGGGTLNTTSTTTDVNGLAQVVLVTDSGPEQYQISADASGLAPVTFYVSAS